MEPKEIQAAVSNALNGDRHGFTKEFAEALVRDHPTLQQLFWRFVQGVAEHYEHHGHTDGRNEASKKFVKHLNEMVKDRNLTLFMI